jgi:hypothetical protein
MFRRSAILLAAIGWCVPAACHAASLRIDDTHPDTITIVWSGFDAAGFSINGSTLSAADSVTLPDGDYTFFGSWFDSIISSFAFTPVGPNFAYFSLPSNPTGVTSGINYSTIPDGNLVSLSGTLGAFTGTVYFTDPNTVPQGQTQNFFGPNLGGSFASETPLSAVPEPTSLTLAGLGALGLAWTRLRRRNGR